MEIIKIADGHYRLIDDNLNMLHEEKDGVLLSTDSLGNEHKGEGTGGGQFVSVATSIQKQRELSELHKQINNMSPPDVRVLAKKHGIKHEQMSKGDMERQLVKMLHDKGLVIKDTFTGETGQRKNDSN